MSLYMQLSTTPELDKLIASLVLHDEIQVPVTKEGTVGYQFALSEECNPTAAKIVLQTLRIVGIHVAFYDNIANPRVRLSLQ
jgi:hypothetical protein